MARLVEEMANVDQQGRKMKLRNKKTGEIRTAYVQVVLENNHPAKPLEFHTQLSLAELNEEWEYYEEPKEFFTISPYKKEGYQVFPYDNFAHIYNLAEELGIAFKTEEEAEKAVEKLKAWKRLKDKGFKFIGVRGIGKVIDFDIPEPYNHVGFDEYVASKDEKEFYDDLLFLFGGEE